MSINAAFVIPQFELSDRLRKSREVAQLSQAGLAEEIGISHKSVTNYENGHYTPRKIVLKAWALRTGVPLAWLETGEAPSPESDGAPEKCTPRDSNPEPIDLRSVRAARMVLAA